jgi:hypothetical protein
MISQELRCIFVHIQKTGGSSIRGALKMVQFDPHKHRFARELRAAYGEEIWRSYFKFAFVRNPWDRLVSWWEMMRRNSLEGRPMNGFQRLILARARTFEEFIRAGDIEIHDPDGSKWIYRNQIDYLSDEEGRLLVDYVGRFERLQADFAEVAARLGTPPVALPHANRTERRPFESYYSPELRDHVGRRYQRDIETFGYRFDDTGTVGACAELRSSDGRSAPAASPQGSGG